MHMRARLYFVTLSWTRTRRTHSLLFAQWFARIDKTPIGDGISRSGGGSTAYSLHQSEDSFEAFFWRFEPQIFGYLWRLINDEQTARDLCQETFLRAWQHFDDISSHRDTGRWLFRVASNLAMTHLRRHHTTTVPIADDEPSQSDPSGRFIERDLVQQILQRLTPRQRAALVLHEVYGLTCSEIGKTLSVSGDAIRMALQRGRQQFREQYLRTGGPS